MSRRVTFKDRSPTPEELLEFLEITVRTIVHNLYLRAGLIKGPDGRMYELRTNSLHKYFRAQLIAHGVPK